MKVPQWSVRFVHVRMGMNGRILEKRQREHYRIRTNNPKKEFGDSKIAAACFCTSASCFPASRPCYIYLDTATELTLKKSKRERERCKFVSKMPPNL